MFYLQYAARNLWRNRRWSTFAIFSIAAGVATIVALRSLGLSIGDSLTSNLRASNHGDVTITDGVAGGFAFSFGDPEESNDGFTPDEIEALQNWTDSRGGELTAYITTSNVQIAAVDAVTVGRPQLITTLFVDPATYPPSHEITALDPPGVPLSQLLTGGNQVVISQNLAETNGIAVGDRARVSGTEDEFIVVGIVSTEHEAGFRNLFAAFFGFAYLDIAQAEPLSINTDPNSVSLTLAEQYAPTTDEAAENIEREIRGLLRGGGRSITTVPNWPAKISKLPILPVN